MWGRFFDLLADLQAASCRVQIRRAEYNPAPVDSIEKG